MATRKQYEQAKADYKYMCETYGEPSDLTGGFVEGDHYYDLLENFTITNACQNYRDLISYGFQMGEHLWETDANRMDERINISDDTRAVEIYDMYC